MIYLSLGDALDENMGLERGKRIKKLTWSLPDAIDIYPALRGVRTVRKAVFWGIKKFAKISDPRGRDFSETKRIAPVTFYLAPLTF